MLKVSQLFIYPIKSLGGIALDSAKLTDRGLEHDRRWMLIDANNRFISQREHFRLALCKTELEEDGLLVTYQPDGSYLRIPFVLETNTALDVTIWDDTCRAVTVSELADQWFSAKLDLPCRLVYMPDDSLRQTDLRYTDEGSITSFSDAYPMLMISQASLDDLNARLAEPLPMDRFRPNIVFTGGEAYCEDQFKAVTINHITMGGVKLCARCVMATVDQQTGTRGKEPLKTLARYRMRNNKIYFGQNVVAAGEGIISVGNDLQVLSLHTEERFFV